MVTLPFSVREGINIFLAGFVPTENLRFREEALTFKVGVLSGEAACARLTCMPPTAASLPQQALYGSPAHCPTRVFVLPPCFLPCGQVSDQGVEGDEEQKKFLSYKYPAMTKTQGAFTLHVSSLPHACPHAACVGGVW